MQNYLSILLCAISCVLTRVVENFDRVTASLDDK
eukprot:UN10411